MCFEHLLFQAFINGIFESKEFLEALPRGLAENFEKGRIFQKTLMINIKILANKAFFNERL